MSSFTSLPFCISFILPIQSLRPYKRQIVGPVLLNLIYIRQVSGFPSFCLPPSPPPPPPPSPPPRHICFSFSLSWFLLFIFDVRRLNKRWFLFFWLCSSCFFCSQPLPLPPSLPPSLSLSLSLSHSVAPCLDSVLPMPSFVLGNVTARCSQPILCMTYSVTSSDKYTQKECLF